MKLGQPSLQPGSWASFLFLSLLSRGSHQEDESSRVYLFKGSCDVKPYPVIRGPDKDFSMWRLLLWEASAAERRCPKLWDQLVGPRLAAWLRLGCLGCMPIGHDFLSLP